jgi:hypothetical protein
VFAGVGIVVRDGQGLHVDYGALKLRDRSFRFDVSAIIGYHGVSFRHLLSPLKFAFLL